MKECNLSPGEIKVLSLPQLYILISDADLDSGGTLVTSSADLASRIRAARIKKFGKAD